MKLHILAAIAICGSLFGITGCTNAYEQKGLCSYMGACNEKDECEGGGTGLDCGATATPQAASVPHDSIDHSASSHDDGGASGSAGASGGDN